MSASPAALACMRHPSPRFPLPHSHLCAKMRRLLFGDICAVTDWFPLVSSPQVRSVPGLSEAIRDVASIRQGPNPGLEVLGVAFNAVDTRTLAVRDTEAFIERHKELRPFTRSAFIPAPFMSTGLRSRGVRCTRSNRSGTSQSHSALMIWRLRSSSDAEHGKR